ncbi:MAG: hypothetical protein HZB39_04855 [Planctomycetes bacterium]|nr:hypothetical protein [Planctomycetota bacterium]
MSSSPTFRAATAWLCVLLCLLSSSAPGRNYAVCLEPDGGTGITRLVDGRCSGCPDACGEPAAQEQERGHESCCRAHAKPAPRIDAPALSAHEPCSCVDLQLPSLGDGAAKPDDVVHQFPAVLPAPETNWCLAVVHDARCVAIAPVAEERPPPRWAHLRCVVLLI